MTNLRYRDISCRTLLALFILGTTSLAKGPVYVDPEKTGADFEVQGEYAGTLFIGESDDVDVGLQLVALGGGKFQGRAYVGGLPGDGWNGEQHPVTTGTLENGKLTLRGESATATYHDGKIDVSMDGTKVGSLKKAERKSPTLGKKPPTGAVVLFDGTTVDAWKDNAKIEDGLLCQGATSRETFQSHHLHVEFRLPFQPEDRGQGRGNSGLYLQGRYEVQMLDSFGLEGKDNECGGIYTIKKPDQNMCYPPLRWQTYDIDFVAAEFDESGEMIKLPRITVRHNGVLIHDQVELPNSTRAAPMKPGPEPGPVYLQDHGNPVRYRNIWAVPKS